MTAPDPRLSEIADRSEIVRSWLRTNLDNPRNMRRVIQAVQAQSTDVSYLLAELRKAQDKLARVEGLARSSKPLQGMGGMYSGIVMADHILAAVADATGGGTHE